MNTHRLVLPGDLNQFGFLFGGKLLAWVDEASWIAATTEFPHCRFVTIGLDNVEFRHSVKEGAILKIRSTRTKLGNSSVSYQVDVFNELDPATEVIFSTSVTFVRVDEMGRKCSIGN